MPSVLPILATTVIFPTGPFILSLVHQVANLTGQAQKPLHPVLAIGITCSNPGYVATLAGGPREQNCLCSLSRRDGIALFPVNQSFVSS